MSSRQNKFIDLKTNGRLFPTWMLANYKKYKLPEIIKNDSVDPCNQNISVKKNQDDSIKKNQDISIKREFKNHQLFISKYLDYRSPNKNILLYHGLGTGKTATTINIYNILYNYTPGWNVFLLIKASLNSSWVNELQNWLTEDERDYRFKNIIFVHYDSPIADKTFLEAIKNADSSKKSLYIIDEAQIFIRNVYSNINSDQGKRAQVIYEHMIQDKKDNEGVRIVCLSGTPAINVPYELALLFNLLRPGAFPKSESEFNEIYLSDSGYKMLSSKTKNMFQRRILGLVSYYKPIEAGVYASSNVNYVDVEMSKYQEEIYSHYEYFENQMALKKKLKQGGQETYKSYTRQSSNFVFPAINQKVNGEERPRPGKFKISEREAEKISEGKEDLKLEKDSGKVMNVKAYLNAIELFINSFIKLLNEKSHDDEKNGHTIIDDVKTFHDKYKDDYDAFHKDEKNKSSLYEQLYTCSAKMLRIIFTIIMSPGPVIVYSNYVSMEGFQIFKIYLAQIGFSGYSNAKSGTDYFKHTDFHGKIDPKERAINLRTFNMPENKHGKLIKIIMISQAGTEGISVFNVRQIHVMEPYWNEARVTQLIGRGIRQCSHKALPLNERHVDVYRYKSIRKTMGKKMTTDQYIEDLARSKDRVIQSYLDAVKEAAIDCALFKEHNMTVQEYKCFQFDEPSLFDKQIGPAYKEDIQDDVMINNGLNSDDSIIVRIKAMKMTGVRLLSKPTDDEPKYSKPQNYWYNSDSYVVYDYDLQYPIGKVLTDDDNIPEKTDDDYYIIDRMIPMPLIIDE
jgi:superfamily II DNA or RNA helicase